MKSVFVSFLKCVNVLQPPPSPPKEFLPIDELATLLSILNLFEGDVCISTKKLFSTGVYNF